jgi:hypothetical protein
MAWLYGAAIETTSNLNSLVPMNARRYGFTIGLKHWTGTADDRSLHHIPLPPPLATSATFQDGFGWTRLIKSSITIPSVLSLMSQAGYDWAETDGERHGRVAVPAQAQHRQLGYVKLLVHSSTPVTDPPSR